MQATNGKVVDRLPQRQSSPPLFEGELWRFAGWFVIVLCLCLTLFVVMPGIRDSIARQEESAKQLKAIGEAIERRESKREADELERSRILSEARKSAVIEQAQILQQTRRLKEVLDSIERKAQP